MCVCLWVVSDVIRGRFPLGEGRQLCSPVQSQQHWRLFPWPSQPFCHHMLMTFASCSERYRDSAPTLLSAHTHSREVIQLCPQESIPMVILTCISFWMLYLHVSNCKWSSLRHIDPSPQISSLPLFLSLFFKKKIFLIRNVFWKIPPLNFYLSEVVFIFTFCWTLSEYLSFPLPSCTALLTPMWWHLEEVTSAGP